MDSKPLSVPVTGSSGLIGNLVARQLHQVMALDKMPRKQPLPVGVRFFACDNQHHNSNNARVHALERIVKLS